MSSFKNVIVKSIRNHQLTREQYEVKIASWNLTGKLTDEEMEEVMVILDQEYPLEEPEEV